MYFNFNKGNGNKAAFRSLITRKQQLFRRLQRRFKASKNPGERAFLKAEAGRVVGELKMFASQWKKNAFGGCTWVTRGYKVSDFNGFPKSRGSSRSRRSRPGSHGKRRSRVGASRKASSAKYRHYVAW